MQIVFELGMWLLNVSIGVALGLWWLSHYYGKLVKQERVWTDEALADTERIAYELESTRKLNVVLARDRDVEKQEVERQIVQRKELRQQVLEQISEIERLKAECEVAVNQRNELRLQVSNLELAYDRCQEAFRDITIHLNDMAYEIASVAPNAKGD